MPNIEVRIRMLALAVASAFAWSAPAPAAPYGRLPLAFEENRGQTDPAVRFLARTPAGSVFLTPDAAVLALGRRRDAAHAVVRLRLVGAQPAAAITGQEAQPGKAHYLLGRDPARWHTDVPTFARVEYAGVYPGIDLVYHGDQGTLEYDVVVAPGADPAAVALDFEGVDRLEVDPQGDLLVHTAAGTLRQPRPAVYEETDGVRRPLDGRYVLRAPCRIGFEVAGRDPSRRLVIDPLLIYSDHLGGSGLDEGFGVAVDGTGAAYVAGDTTSTDFPASTATTFKGVFDAFVAKISPDGHTLVWATYLGGKNDDEAFNVAVDSLGSAYVTGMTASTDFPVTSGAAKTSKKGGFDVFVTKLAPDGASLAYSTFAGGRDDDIGLAIALDTNKNAYVTGYTSSSDYPKTTGVVQTMFGGGADDAFVTKVNPTGTAFTYSTLLGWNDFDQGVAITVDGAGVAFVAGQTASTNLPTPVGAAQKNFGGGAFDGFVVKLNATATALTWATYLGGSGDDEACLAIGLDPDGDVWVTGNTSSSDFPIRPGAPQPTWVGGGNFDTDAFVTQIDRTGTQILSSTFLGGANGDDGGLALKVDANGRVHVAGITESSDFPIGAGAFQPTFRFGGSDAFVAALDALGHLAYSTFLGGSGLDEAYGLALDTNGAVYVAGITRSVNFPATSAFVTPSMGTSDVFVAKIDPDAAPPTTTTTTRPATTSTTTTKPPTTTTSTTTTATTTTATTTTPTTTSTTTSMQAPTTTTTTTTTQPPTTTTTIAATTTTTTTTQPTTTSTTTTELPTTTSTTAASFPTTTVTTTSSTTLASSTTTTPTTSTTTMTVPPGCEVAPTVASLLCRLDALIVSTGAVTDSGTQRFLLRKLARVRNSVLKAGVQLDAGRAAKAASGFRRAANGLVAFQTRVQFLFGKKIDPALAAALVAEADPIRLDLVPLGVPPAKSRKASNLRGALVREGGAKNGRSVVVRARPNLEGFVSGSTNTEAAAGEPYQPGSFSS